MLSQILAGYAEFTHLEVEGCSFQAQAGGRTLRASNHTFGFAEHFENVLPFGRFEGDRRCGRRFGRQFQFGNRSVEHRAFGQDGSPFNEVFELANISWPRPVGERPKRLWRDSLNLSI